MRNCRSSLAKSIREAIFKVCPKVPEIKASAGSSNIAEWKGHPYVAEAYDSLWNADGSGLITINKIISTAKEDRSRTSIIAFTLAICCICLKPNINDVRCNEEATKKRYIIFMVSGFLIKHCCYN